MSLLSLIHTHIYPHWWYLLQHLCVNSINKLHVKCKCLCVFVCTDTTLHVPQANVPFSWPHVSSNPRSLKCICAHVLAAITHLNPCTHTTSGLPPVQVRGRKWAERKGGSSSSSGLAAGTDPEPWPLTSACIILATQTDKTQTCKCSFENWMF